MSPYTQERTGRLMTPLNRIDTAFLTRSPQASVGVNALGRTARVFRYQSFGRLRRGRATTTVGIATCKAE